MPAVEVIGDKRRFSDGSVTFAFFYVPSAHVDEMLVPFIPSEGIIYVADGFTRAGGPDDRRANSDQPVQKVGIGYSHGVAGPWSGRNIKRP